MTALGRSSQMPELNTDDLADAAFRARDRAWVALAELFDKLQEEESLTYEKLGRKIKKHKTQVHKWLSSPCNVTLQSLGLLAEGMNADLHIHLVERLDEGTNGFHDCERAALRIKFEDFVVDYEQRRVSRENVTLKPSSFGIMADAV